MSNPKETICIRLDEVLLDIIKSEAKKRRVSESTIIEKKLFDYYDLTGKIDLTKEISREEK